MRSNPNPDTTPIAAEQPLTRPAPMTDDWETILATGATLGRADG